MLLRRFVGALAGAVTIALAVTAAIAVAGPAGRADAAAVPDRAPMTLTQSGAKQYAALLSQLDAQLYSPKLASIFNSAAQDDDLNRTMTACNPSMFSGDGALSHLSVPLRDAWCWNSGDESVQDWMPQGITGISDAQEDESWGSEPQRPIVVSWYSNPPQGGLDQGARITLIDPATHRYRHLLLVEPFSNSKGNASYQPVNVHAGGIAWYGNFLYVPDTRKGIRVFDLTNVFDLDPLGSGHRTQDPKTDADTKSKTKIGRHDNVFYGYGYRYLVPQISTWSQPSQARDSQECLSNDTGMRFSYLTVDRGGLDSLAAGEYCLTPKADDADKDKRSLGRMAAWPLASLRQLTIDKADGNKVAASSASFLPSGQVQGIAHAGANWYFSVSHACSPSSMLLRTPSNGGWSGSTKWDVPAGSEDLYLWRRAFAMYSLTEHPTCNGAPGRAVYSLSVS